MGLFATNQGLLGIDIGTSSIKIVELKKETGGPKLITYGYSENSKISTKQIDDIKNVSNMLLKVCEEAGFTSKTAIAALPTYSVFSSVMNLSNVKKKDLASAVNWEAKKVVPLPLEEMILDWIIISEDEKQGNIKILLTGATKSHVKKYVEIFKEAQISLLSLETETFSLIRSLVGNDKSSIMLIDVGNETTDITIVDNLVPTLNRSIDVGGKMITDALNMQLGIGLEKTEQFKYDLGMSFQNNSSVNMPRAISESIAPIINEIKYTLNLYQGKDSKKVEKIILTGGSALLYNLTDYLSSLVDIRTIVGNPWSHINYPEELKIVLEEIGPRLAVAAGLALRGM